MSVPASLVPALLPGATQSQILAVLGAMRAVAEVSGPASAADRTALASTDRYIFGHADGPGFDAIQAVPPDALAKAVAGTEIGADAVKFLTIMAVIDGRIDTVKIALVQRYAAALGISGAYLTEIGEAAKGQIQAALADMTRLNMQSITGKPWTGGDVGAWLLPYAGSGADPALAQRFHALGKLAPESFGHAFWQHFTSNGYDFPGEAKALNATFSVPHDSVHVLSGFGTTGRGEVLASTFTAAMHRSYPMAGHILPAIFSWHLNVQINAVAGDAAEPFDADIFWKAWAAGAAAKVDTFAPGWDFWAVTEVPLRDLRVRYGIPPQGLDAAETVA